MGVDATLPELSEWTSKISVFFLSINLFSSLVISLVK